MVVGVSLRMCDSGTGLPSAWVGLQVTGHVPQNGKYKFTTMEERCNYIYLRCTCFIDAWFIVRGEIHQLFDKKSANTVLLENKISRVLTALASSSLDIFTLTCFFNTPLSPLIATDHDFMVHTKDLRTNGQDQTRNV